MYFISWASVHQQHSYILKYIGKVEKLKGKICTGQLFFLQPSLIMEIQKTVVVA